MAALVSREIILDDKTKTHDPSGNALGPDHSERTRRVRMQDVARLSGVSLSTVSRAINTPEQVSGELRRRIDDAMRTLTYVPNRMAGSLAAKKSRAIGLIIPTMRNSAFATIVEELTDIFDSHGYQTFISHTDYSLEKELKATASLLSWSAAAMILTGRHHSRQTVNMLLTAEVPVVEMWDVSDQAIDTAIGISHDDVGRYVASYFVKSGAKRLGLVSAAIGQDIRATQRANGFLRSAEQLLGVPPVHVTFEERGRAKNGGVGLGRILDEAPDTDAIFYTNDTLAIGGLFECQRRCVKVPDDLRICGFGDSILSEASNPLLSTVRPPHEQIAHLTAQHVLDRLNGVKSEGEIIRLDFQHIIRETG